MKYPNVWTLKELIRHVIDGPQASVDGKMWVPGRPLGFMSISNRIRCAWMVFTGKADAVIWPAGQ